MKWSGRCTESSLVDGGAPLGHTKRVDAKGVSDAKNGVGGYSIVQATRPTRRRNCSARITRTCKCRGPWVEVVEIMQIPGM